jgi:hypothetical protein
MAALAKLRGAARAVKVPVGDEAATRRAPPFPASAQWPK